MLDRAVSRCGYQIDVLEPRRLLSGTPHMLADLNDMPAPSTTLVLGKVNDVLLFTHNDGIHGEELWRTDATGSGTSLLSDITPGRKGSELELIGNAGGYAYFKKGYYPAELWRTDGTAQGTIRVTSVSQLMFGVPVGNKLFFADFDSNYSASSLWITDGSLGGTKKVKDLPVLGSGFAVDGKCFFFSGDSKGVNSIWTSDGTEAGTQKLADFKSDFDGYEESRNPRFVTAGESVFLIRDEQNKDRRFSKLLRFTGEGFESIYRTREIRSTGSIGNKLYFSTWNGQLWRTDGTGAGCKMLLGSGADPISDDNNPSQGDTDRLYFGDFGDAYCVRGDRVAKVHAQLGTRIGKLLYFAKDKAIWRSDGSAAGTFKVADYDVSDGADFFAHFTKLGSKVIINTEDEPQLGRYHQWIWSTDGSKAGTRTLADQEIDGRRTLTSAVVGKKFLYVIARKESGKELWTSDGTKSSIKKIKTLFLPNLSSNPYDFENIGGKLFFTTRGTNPNDDEATLEYWWADGTLWVTSPGGTPKQLLNGIGIYPSISRFDNRTVITGGEGVWISDSTNRKYTQIYQTESTDGNDGPIWAEFVGHRGTKFYFADNTEYDTDYSSGIFADYYETDGTAAGTHYIEKLPASLDQSPHDKTVRLGTTTYTLTQHALWRQSDFGNELSLVKSFEEATGTYLAAGKDKVFFELQTVLGLQLWSSDGVTTTKLKDFDSPAIYGKDKDDDDSIPIDPNGVAAGDGFYFTAYDSGVGRALWYTDGTRQGTHLVEGFPAGADVWPRDFIRIGSTLFFSARDSQHGRELWEMEVSS